MKKIFLYKDEGASIESLDHLWFSLKKLIRKTAVAIDAKTIIQGNWKQNCSILIVPGGRDRLFHQALFPEGTRQIREFVEQGGTYLGICAGAYFASAKVEFEKGGELEIVDKRDLGFFPGIAIGPAYGRLGEFHYDASIGARIGRLLFPDGTKMPVYFHGGNIFQDAHKYPNVEILARYEDLPGQPAAIISCKVGKGKAILSGVHMEVSPEKMSCGSDNLAQIRTVLLKTESFSHAELVKILMTNP